MNVVVDEATEVYTKDGKDRRSVGASSMTQCSPNIPLISTQAGYYSKATISRSYSK